MNTDNKTIAFEYVMYRLFHGRNSRDISKLKALKLLFFVCAAETLLENDQYGDSSSLLELFDNFQAMPYGPVEVDCYNSILDSNGDLNTVFIEERRGHLKKTTDENSFEQLDEQIRIRIDYAVDILLDTNKKIVDYTPFELVDLSHMWSCWIVNMEFAEQINCKIFPMTTDEIRNSTKHFTLNRE